jgi:cob(I)alamin adenosyltransferase
MTLEELADLIRANSANTDGRIDRVAGDLRDVAGHVQDVVGHVRELRTFIDRRQNETNAALMNVQNDLTDVRGDKALKTDVSSVRQTLDLASTITAMRREIDDLRAEVADLKRRAS